MDVFAVLAALVFSVHGVPGVAEADARQVKFHVTAYLPEYEMAGFKVESAKLVTELLYFSAGVGASGELDTRRCRPESLKILQSAKKQYGVRLFLCVGGDGHSQGFAAMSASAAARQEFLGALQRFCRDNDFDGVDLDWEHPVKRDEVRNFGKLLAEVKKGLTKDGLELSIAVAGWQQLPTEGIAAVDRINLMAYDGKGRHSTMAFAEADVARLRKQGVPLNKICLGVPFYGRNVNDAENALSYSNIVRRSHPGPAVDEIYGMYFNGMNTIERKTRYALEHKLAGVMIWEIGQDTHDSTSLLQAIRRAAPER
jgi:GH18 family chitinase